MQCSGSYRLKSYNISFKFSSFHYFALAVYIEEDKKKKHAVLGLPYPLLSVLQINYYNSYLKFGMVYKYPTVGQSFLMYMRVAPL